MIKELVKAIQEYTKDFEANLKKTVPVRKGTLRDSIKVIPPLQRQNEVRGGIEMLYYGQYVDQGTRYFKGRKFISKAFAETKFDKDVENEITNTIDKMFDKTFNR